jgi:pyruvate kinase
MNSPSTNRRAKIVATLGPASSDPKIIEELIEAGVNVFRFNFSHGTHPDHEARFNIVRAASKKLEKPVAILQDLQGPKLRVGNFAGGSITIAKGEEVVLKLETAGKPAAAGTKTIPYNYERLPAEVQVGHRILMDDGNLEVVVRAIKGDEIHAEVVFGGVLKDHKGMNFPDTRVTIEAFTPKDQEDLEFGLKLGVDFVALSFVRTPDDIRNVRKFMHAHGSSSTPIISKIEKGEAIENLEEILSVSDAIMVARGDLAVEVGTAQVPILQKQIIRECNARGIPVITATQMLETMVTNNRPTRAEASDIANAVLDGTDALMLSAETASGKYPVLSVATMQSVILETERKGINLTGPVPLVEPETAKVLEGIPVLVEAIEHAAAHLAGWIGAKAIACTTHTGQAARALARSRPEVPIVAFTDSTVVRRRLALVWGVESSSIEPSQDLDKLFTFAEVELARRGIVHKGDRVVLTAGWPPLQHGTTNLLKVVTVRSDYVLKK